MNKIAAFIFALTFGWSCSAQEELKVGMGFGLNRIGFISELEAEYKTGRHGISLGIRLYEPDLVFQRDFPGIQLGYLFDFKHIKNTTTRVGVGAGFFYEARATSNILLFNPELRMRMETDFFERFSGNIEFGAGAVMNRVETIPDSKTESYTYFNYEITLGISYRLWDDTRN